MREFKFFRGYKESTLTEQWGELFRYYPSTPGTGILNLGTTTPSIGTYTIPYFGTGGAFPLTGTITTTGGVGTILTTNTGYFNTTSINTFLSNP